MFCHGAAAAARPGLPPESSGQDLVPALQEGMAHDPRIAKEQALVAAMGYITIPP